MNFASALWEWARISLMGGPEHPRKDWTMLFLVAGILKTGVEDRLIELRNEFNEHLSQPNRKIALAGLLRNKDGHRKGYVAFIEAENFEDAESWLHESPFYQNDLYERVQVAEFNPEVGFLE
jgi:uncharacterized protein YciI